MYQKLCPDENKVKADFTNLLEMDSDNEDKDLGWKESFSEVIENNGGDSVSHNKVNIMFRK